MDEKNLKLKEMSPVGLFQTDLKGNYLLVNERWTQMTGISQESALGLGWVEAIHPEDKETVLREWFNFVAKRGIFLSEYRIKRKDRNITWVSCQALPIRHQNDFSPIGFMGALTNVDHLKQSELKIKKSEESLKKKTIELNALLDATKNVMKYRNFEKASRAIFDSCKELIGAKSGYVALLSPDGAENELVFLESGGLPCTVSPELPMPIRGLRAESYKSRKAVYDNNFMKSEWVQFMPKGHVALKNVMFAPLNLEGKTVGIMGMANKEGDFTENDAQLASAFSELAAIALYNSKLIESLNNSQASCVAALEREDLYSDILAHDMNNVLTNLSLGVELLKKSKNNPGLMDSKKIDNIFDNLKGQITRGINLISNIQKLSQMKEEGFNFEIRDTLEILKKVQNRVLNTYPQKKINIDIDSEIQECPIKCDALIEDVFENLMLNAIQYNDSEIKRIEIKISREDVDGTPHFKFQFIDNGMGIHEEMKKRLFKERIEKESRKKGMGMGLLLVNKIIKNIGGRIKTQNRIPEDYTKGSNFIILLPEGA